MAPHLPRLFGGKRRVPPSFPTDEVVPVHVLDDQPGYRTTLMTWTFQFNDVLDPNKLRDSLYKLISEGEDWRKLGGRLRLTAAKKLEIHIPQPFTEERPPARFTQSRTDSRLADHQLASQLPSLNSTRKEPIHPGPDYFLKLGVPDYAPRTTEDYVYSDEPMLAVHVRLFKDATFVSLQHLHIVTDTMGFVTLMKAWQLVLAGKSDVPRFLGLTEDPMAAFYAADKTEDYVLTDKQLKGGRLVLFILRFIWRRMWQKYESRTICLTAETFAAMRSAAIAQLPEVDDVEKGPPFISDGDILAAWASHTTAGSGRRGTILPLTLIIPADVRCRARDVFPEQTACLQNAIMAIFVQLSASHLRRDQLGETALEVRRAIMEQTTRPQINALARIAVETSKAGGHPPFLADNTGTMPVIITNWAKANFFEEIDFSPAVVTPGKEGNPGRVVYYQADPSRDSPFALPLFTIYGKDTGGNYWVSGYLPVSKWAVLEKSMAEFNDKA